VPKKVRQETPRAAGAGETPARFLETYSRFQFPVYTVRENCGGNVSKTISLELAPAIAKSPNKGGRPRKEIVQHTFEGLCEIQCTLEEIAAVLRVSEDTVERWCKRIYELGFADAFKKFSATGKTSLRRYQLEAAKKGNPTMLIWLGKQYLGQTDKPTAEEPDEELDLEKISSDLLSAMLEVTQREADQALQTNQLLE
jgi:hypothetical protein